MLLAVVHRHDAGALEFMAILSPRNRGPLLALSLLAPGATTTSWWLTGRATRRLKREASPRLAIPGPLAVAAHVHRVHNLVVLCPPRGARLK
jgi:hypothetical protein